MSSECTGRALHLLDLPGGPIIFDTNRVATYRCSPLEARLLRAAAGGRETDDDPANGVAPADLDEANERLARLERLSESLAGTGGLDCDFSGHPSQLFLHVCHDCNLECPYCYAADCGLGMGHLFMTEETARAAIDYLFSASSPDRDYVCTFAGGEPLLNPGVVEAAARHARELAERRGVALRCRVFTNGTVMSERLFHLISANDLFLQITVDGPPDSHDRLRPGRGGKPTSHKILETIRFLENKGFRQFTVRSNLCPGNADPRRIEEFFRRHGLERFYLMPVIADRGSPYRLGGEDLRRITEHYIQLAGRAPDSKASGSPEEGETPQELAPFLTRLQLGLKSRRYCGAGRELLVVSPEGDLYPCPAMVGEARFRIGSLREGTTVRSGGAFRNRAVDDKPACARCWARNLCGGGCALQAARVNGDDRQPDVMECAVIQAKISAAVSLFHRQKGVHA